MLRLVWMIRCVLLNFFRHDDEVKGGMLADHLSKINDERKTIVTSIMRKVHKKLDAYEHKEVIVIGNPNWRGGNLGACGGKISDQYKNPFCVGVKMRMIVLKVLVGVMALSVSSRVNDRN